MALLLSSLFSGSAAATSLIEFDNDTVPAPTVPDPRQPPRLIPATPVDDRVIVPDSYTETKSAHFRFVFPAGATRYAASLLARAEMRRAQYVATLGVDPPKEIRLILVRSSEDFQKMQPGGHFAPFWAAGLTYPALGLIYLRQSGSQGQPVDVEKTLDHELSHALFHAAVGENEVPRWFDEGLAQWQARELDIERIVRLSGAVFTGRLIALDKLEEHFPSHVADVHLAYDESYEFINFLVGEYGPARFAVLIKTLARGLRIEAALLQTYGKRLDELENDWHASLRLSYAWLPLITSGTLVWLLASLLFLWGYAKRRRANKARLAAWDEEDRQRGRHPFDLAPRTFEEEGEEETRPDEASPGDDERTSATPEAPSRLLH